LRQWRRNGGAPPEICKGVELSLVITSAAIVLPVPEGPVKGAPASSASKRCCLHHKRESRHHMSGCDAARIRLHSRPLPARHTTADRMAAHRKLDRRRVILTRSYFLAAALFPFRLLPAQSLVFVDGKMVFQSSFMLITIQPFFFASAISASLKVPIFDSAP